MSVRRPTSSYYDLPVTHPQTPPSGKYPSAPPHTLITATQSAPITLIPPRTLTSANPLVRTSSLKSHRPSGSLASLPPLTYVPVRVLLFSLLLWRTTAQSALWLFGDEGEVVIFPSRTSSLTRSSSHFARSLRCNSSYRSRSFLRLRCRSVAHLASRTSANLCSPWA